MNSYLIRNGLVFDGRGNEGQRLDVRVRDGVIAEIAAELSGPESTSEAAIDAAGLLVVPGLIDLHAHAYEGLLWSCNAHQAGLSGGVTTLLDTGSAGAMTWETFDRVVLKDAGAEVLALLNISLMGVWQGPFGHEAEIGGELCDLRHIHEEWAVACIEKNRHRIVGTKARLTHYLADDKVENERAALHRGLSAARRTGGFFMVHHAASLLSHVEVLGALRAGDVYTHFYHPTRNEIFHAGGPELEAFFQARSRGVILDVGHGAGGFGWPEARQACVGRGLWPDTISTDLHRFNISGPVFDLPTTMSKFLHLGMSLPDVIQAATSRPAQAMKIGHRCGLLEVGRQADITLLEPKSGAFSLFDARGSHETASRLLVPRQVLKGGEMFPCVSRFAQANTQASAQANTQASAQANTQASARSQDAPKIERREQGER